VDAVARNGATLLSSAERNGHRAVVEVLVAAGANAPASRRNRDSTTSSDEEAQAMLRFARRADDSTTS